MLPLFYFVLPYNQYLVGTNLTETSKKQYRRLELSDNRSPRKVGNASDISGQSKQEPLLSNYIEPERPSVTANFNLRKSLAWDSAFSTSKGKLLCAFKNIYYNPFCQLFHCILFLIFTISSSVHTQEFWILRMMILSYLTLGILLTFLGQWNGNF